MQRVNSRPYEEYRQEQRQQNFIKLRWRSIFIICWALIDVVIFGYILYKADPSNWGNDVRSLFIWYMAFSVINVLTYTLMISSRPLQDWKIVIITITKTMLIIWCIILYFITIFRFFSGTNDCRKASHTMWIGFLFLLIEAFIYIPLYLLSCCCLVIGFFAYRALVNAYRLNNREEEGQMIEGNLQVADMLLLATHLKLNPKELHRDDWCCICLWEFSKDETIIWLPCDKKHIFHISCITDWVKQK